MHAALLVVISFLVHSSFLVLEVTSGADNVFDSRPTMGWASRSAAIQNTDGTCAGPVEGCRAIPALFLAVSCMQVTQAGGALMRLLDPSKQAV